MPDEGKNEVSKIDDTAAQRYKLLSIARHVTYGHGVTGCCMHMIDLSQPVSIRWNEQNKRAGATNVQTCKSVWVCPVCADRITRGRAAELLKGMETWQTGGNSVSMATYTLSHNQHESARVVLDRLMSAFNTFKSGRAYQSLKKAFGIAGSVRALEVTYGANGWHWHIHELYFLEGKSGKRHASMLYELREKWRDSVFRAGGAVVAKGFTLSHETSAAFDYVAKWGKDGQKKVWGLAREVVRSPAKMGRGGLHPFQILATANRNGADCRVWNEFVQSSKRVQQLRYSVGLKELLGIDEKSDGELADAEMENARVTLVHLPRGAWYALNVKAGELVGEFWQVAGHGDADLLLAWCEDNNITAYPALVDTSTK